MKRLLMNFMKTNAATINSNLKSLWIAIGGKEDIAYNNCKIMLSKFDEMGNKVQLYRISRRPHMAVWRNNLYNFAPLLFK